MALTTRDERTTRRRRVQAFVREPLVITSIGVVVSIVLYVVVYHIALGPECTGDNRMCRWHESSTAFETHPVLLLGVLITGLVVGLVSHPTEPAFRTVAAGVMVPLLVYGVALVLPDTLARAALTAPWKPTFGDYFMTTVGGLVIGAVVGLIALIPAAIGFGVGRLGQRTRQ